MCLACRAGALSTMKLNIAYPANGTQKLFDIDDEHRVRCFYDKRIGQEVEGDLIGGEFKGYIFKITGGNDKQGFPMKDGVLHASRVRLLLRKGDKCYRPRRSGEHKRKTVRGSIVGPDLAVLSLVVLKQGDDEIEGLTDVTLPKSRGPKRADKIRKLFGLTEEDDVRQFVIRREVEKNGKVYSKAPKIQRLVTPRTIQNKRRKQEARKAQAEKSKREAAEYAALLARRASENK